MALADARAKALTSVRAAKAARDPQREEREAAEAKAASERTVEAMLEIYRRRHLEKLRTGRDVWLSMKLHVLPKIGAKIIDEVKRRDLVAILDGNTMLRHGGSIAPLHRHCILPWPSASSVLLTCRRFDD
jgi:hypothetical protein